MPGRPSRDSTAGLEVPGNAEANLPRSQQAQVKELEDAVMIARQPIFDRNSTLFGYELLFRSTSDNVYQAADARLASAETMSRALHSVGLQTVVGDKLAFFNFTPELLVEEMYAALPKDRCVFEANISLAADPRVFQALRSLRGAGYKLAFDSVAAPPPAELQELADFIKLDFQAIPPAQRKALVQSLAGHGRKIVAEKIESRADLEAAMDAGCDFAQGYFFCKPEVLIGKSLSGSEMIYLEFMKELNKSPLDYDALERVIKRDATLALKLLRYLNSAAFGVRNKVTSIQRALTLLGDNTVRKWGALVVMTNAAQRRPRELLVTTLVRAHFCEIIANAEGMRGRELEMFLVGLLSSADAIFGAPMDKVLDNAVVPESVAAVLLNKPDAPRDLANTLKLALACERGAWGTVIEVAAGLKLTQSEIAVIYYEAMMWADQSMTMAAAA